MMQELINILSKKEIEFLKSKRWNELDDTLDLEDVLSNYIQLHCLTDDDNLTEDGILCESILNKIGEL